jgi:uncharacterized lipoprotein YddW (UPF0748 family)
MLVPVLALLGALASTDQPPPAPREFRGVWVATIDRIDWPPDSQDVDKQKSALRAIFEKAASLHLNAILLQVRPMADAFYRSSYEPWSEFLTGAQGKAPSQDWDPLEFAVEEAHKRGLQLHAWFNPYRVWHSSAKSPPAANYLGTVHPSWVRSYGKMKWLDPGVPDARKWSEKVILDVVQRYDIDGVHIDDYFYPYPIRAGNGIVPFPDDASWNRYVGEGGKLSRDNWRRENNNNFVSDLYRAIKKAKPWIQFGISPFGIYRPGIPKGIDAGIDQYAELYSDPVKWLQSGWCDYLTPQLYWQIKKTPQSYPVLAKWWADQNVLNRHLWIGNNASQVSTNWPAKELIDQIDVTRQTSGTEGNILFSMKPLMKDSKGIDEDLLKGPYSSAALVPLSPWLHSSRPARPFATLSKGDHGFFLRLAHGSSNTCGYSFYTKVYGKWQFAGVLGDEPTGYKISESTMGAAEKIAVAGIDRYANESPRVVLSLPKSAR